MKLRAHIRLLAVFLIAALPFSALVACSGNSFGGGETTEAGVEEPALERPTTELPQQNNSSTDHTEPTDTKTEAEPEAALPKLGAARLISEIGADYVYSDTEEALFDGMLKSKTFAVGGEDYCEGLILRSNANLLFGSKTARAAFRLGGAYETLKFRVGHLTACGVYKDDILRIYADGVQLGEDIPLLSTHLAKEYRIDIRGCNELKLEVVGHDSMYRPAWGFFDMAVYQSDADSDASLFEKAPAAYPESANLITDIGVYALHTAASLELEKPYFNAGTEGEYFMIGEEQIYAGFLLRTGVFLTPDGEAPATAFAFRTVALTVAGLDADELHESAFAAVNTRGEYKSVTFTAARYGNTPVAGMQKETKLMIGADHACAAELTLSPNMEPTTYTVQIDGCEQLLFWLCCGSEDSASAPYAFYNITLNK